MRTSRSTAERSVQHELWALALLLLALLLALSFLPPALFGASGARLFPTGNIVGRVGAILSRAAWDLCGIGAFALPLLPALWAGRVLERLPLATVQRYTILLVGLLLLVPAGIFAFLRPVLAHPPASVGWLGRAIGAPLTLALGWLGAGLLISFALAALCVTTIRWNPLRLVLRGGVLLGSGTLQLGRGAGHRLARSLRARLDRRRAAIASRPAPAPAATRAAPGELPAFEAEAAALDEEILPWDLAYEPLLPPASEEELPAPLVPAAAPPERSARERKQAKEPAYELADAGDLHALDRPSTTLLTPPPPRDEARNRRHLAGLGQVLIEKLATFKIEGEIVGTTSGPVVTQFEVSPAPGIKVARIANLDADLALAMRAPSVRIVAPIPGKGAVGVEVPNPEPEMVFFREVLEAGAFRNSQAQLPLALGKDIAGKPYVADLARMPHLLIAGATGSGKSVCINTIITSLVYRHTPRSLRLLMVDPKMVELSMYNDLPHLRHPVVTDNNEAAGVLKWAVLEMEWRYALLSANNVRNLQDFNRRLEEGQILRATDPQGEEGDPDRWVYQGGPLPFIVVVIDELADLMMTVQGEVEKPLALLAQKARAIGIHLILATQRPSVNVITGLIKANFPSRIAFRVSSKVDSRTILDQNGADSLLGNGDMLFLPPGQSDPMRLQGAFLSTEETEQLMEWYRERKRQREEAPLDAATPEEPDILEVVRAAEGAGAEAEASEEGLQDRDRLFREAAELCIQHQGGSTSLLQRRLRIGYGRAARIIDQLHHAGILGPPDGSKPREVLLDLIQLEQMYPSD